MGLEDEGWKNKAPTAVQKRILREYRYVVDRNMTRGKAATIIEGILTRSKVVTSTKPLITVKKETFMNAKKLKDDIQAVFESSKKSVWKKHDIISVIKDVYTNLLEKEISSNTTIKE